MAKGGMNFVVVAIYYFTKWVEVETLVTIMNHVITKFLRKSVLCRFSIPQSIISDNDRQFSCLYY